MTVPALPSMVPEAPLLSDRTYVSRYATTPVGVSLVYAGAPTDADGSVAVHMTNVDTGAIVLSLPAATHVGTGVYGVTLGADQTKTPGNYDVTFSYAIAGLTDWTIVHLEIGQASPTYDALAPAYKAMVENVWVRFADAFDSALGGPFLQTPLQTHFGRDRLARLLIVAVGRLNTIAQPHTTYSITDPANPFPIAQWGALAEQAAYVEVIKHLIRSYVEQPQVNLSSSVSRLDRRDYMQRWEEVLNTERDDLERMLSTFKIANMGLGSATGVLVAGGLFPRLGGEGFSLGEAAARGYFPVRFYGGIG